MNNKRYSYLFIVLSISIVSLLLFYLFGNLISCGGSSSGGSTGVVSVDDSLDGATGIAVNSTFEKTFSQVVNTATVLQTSFFIVNSSASSSISAKAAYDSSICDSANKLDALVSCVSSLKCSLDPVSDLDTSTQYTICLSSDITYSDETSHTAEMYTFTTSSTETEVGGTVTISGTLSLAADASISKDVGKATAADGYRVLILDMTTGEQRTTTTGADGSFSIEAVGGSDYSINFMDGNYKYVGTLQTNTPSENKVAVALTTGEDESTTDLGAVTANSSTGQVTSNSTLNASTSHLAYAPDNGVIAGGNSGDGTTDYTDTVGATACDASTATCPDFDRDGVPDIFDTDNNNDGYSDEVDGQYDYCIPGEVKLYVTNYPAACAALAAQPGYPTPDEVSANLGPCSKYVINMELTPTGDTTIDDISEVSVTTPGYITQYGYVSNVESGHACFNTLWNTCNGQKLMLSDDGTKYEIGISRDGSESGTAPILENMFPGDTFILNIAMADGTEHVCSRKINIIPKYYAYNVKKNDVLIDTSETVQLSLTFPFTMSWTIPVQSPVGMTYSLHVIPYDASCGWDPDNPTVITAGQDATSKVVTAADMPTSAVNYWTFDVYSSTVNGDQAHETGIPFTSSGTNPCAP